MSVSAIVLAAGEGTRMRSRRPKPLHLICGRAMVLHVIHALEQVRPERTALVVGHGAEQVTKKVQELAPAWASVVFVEQPTPRGTGDAAAHGMSAFPGDDLDDESTVVVLPGDTPLLRPETLDELVASHVANGNAATLLTSVLDDPTGYGRVIRAADDRVLRIVEQGDAGPDELAIKEVATSIYAFRREVLGPALRHVSPDNAQGEFYLTDVVGVLGGMGHRIACVQAPADETQGVNDRWQLALAERELRARTNRAWLLNGVTMLDPAADVHRRDRQPRPRRHAVSRARSCRATPSSATDARSVPTPGSSTAWSAGAAWFSTPSASRPRSATAPGSVPTPTCRRDRPSRPTPSAAPSTLRPRT